MPLILPHGLIDKESLKYEKIFTMDYERAYSQDIRPLKVAIVNLMPKKEETELQLIRMLSNTALQIDISLIRMGSHQSKNTSPVHLERFYRTYEEIKDEKFDAMVITGAPVERFEYEEIIYWSELKDVFEFARTQVFSTLFICWSAQAGLYHFYDIDNQLKKDKIFGIYEYEKNVEDVLIKGFDDKFYIPQSRYSLVGLDQVKDREDLDLLIGSEETGGVLMASKDKRLIFNFGHWEYDRDTLKNEYIRDLEKEEEIKPPINYFKDDDPNKDIIVRWRSAGNLFFANWINYCVYQETPYNIEEISEKIL